MTDKEILSQLKEKLESQKRDLTDKITGKEYCDDPKCVKLELLNELLEIIQSNSRRPKFKEGDVITSDNGKDSCKITRLLDDAYEVTNDEIKNDANQVSWIIKFEDQDNWRLVSEESTLMILFPSKERDDKHICFSGGCPLFSGQKQEGLCEALWKSSSFKNRSPLASICNYYDTMKPTIIEAQNISIEEIQERIKG